VSCWKKLGESFASPGGDLTGDETVYESTTYYTFPGPDGAKGVCEWTFFVRYYEQAPNQPAGYGGAWGVEEVVHSFIEVEGGESVAEDYDYGDGDPRWFKSLSAAIERCDELSAEDYSSGMGWTPDFEELAS
jgi:hypothetical protein